MATQSFVIDGPIPEPPLFRLLDVAEVVEPDDPHWRNGVQMWGYPPSIPVLWESCAQNGTFLKNDGDAAPLPEFPGFTNYLSITCTAAGIDWTDPASWKERGLRAFNAVESYALEKEISQGLMAPLSPHFDDANLSILGGGTAKKPQVGLSYLEDAIGATARRGMIHGTPGTVTAWGKEFLVFRQDGELITPVGSRVATGDGYIGGDPAGGSSPTTGQAWAYATGRIKIIRDKAPRFNPDNFSQALNRAQNIITFEVERDYVVGWDTELQAGVLIDWTT
jgi:hypothetical protein